MGEHQNHATSRLEDSLTFREYLFHHPFVDVSRRTITTIAGRVRYSLILLICQSPGKEIRIETRQRPSHPNIKKIAQFCILYLSFRGTASRVNRIPYRRRYDT